MGAPSYAVVDKRAAGSSSLPEPPADPRGRACLIRTSFRATDRLKLTKAFRIVYQRGQWAHSPSLSVGVRANALNALRLGLRTKRGLKGAVVRNRLRRQFRAIYRSHKAQLTPGVDLVVVIHPRALPVEPGAMEQEFLDLCKRLHLLS